MPRQGRLKTESCLGGEAQTRTTRPSGSSPGPERRSDVRFYGQEVNSLQSHPTSTAFAIALMDSPASRPNWMRHRFVPSMCFFPFVIVLPSFALPELAGSAYDTPDWRRTSPLAGVEGGGPGTHESTFAGAARLATPRFTSVVLCGSERRARCSPRACLASGTGKLRVGRHRPDDRGRMGV